ncbi:hypothetical protein GCM10023222_41370 [Saccharopolyspora cebuensis]
MAAHGLRATTLRAVAAEAGVTTGAVTHYFEDKGAVLDAVLRHNNALALARTEKAVGRLRGLTAAHRHALALLPTGAEGMAIWRVWLAFWVEADAPSGLTTGWDEWRRSLGALLAQAVADGELPGTTDLRYEAERIGTLIAGIGLVYGTARTSRQGPSRRGKRLLDDHFTALTAMAPAP